MTHINTDVIQLKATNDNNPTERRQRILLLFSRWISRANAHYCHCTVIDTQLSRHKITHKYTNRPRRHTKTDESRCHAIFTQIQNVTIAAVALNVTNKLCIRHTVCTTHKLFVLVAGSTDCMEAHCQTEASEHMAHRHKSLQNDHCATKSLGKHSKPDPITAGLLQHHTRPLLTPCCVLWIT